MLQEEEDMVRISLQKYYQMGKESLARLKFKNPKPFEMRGMFEIINSEFCIQIVFIFFNKGYFAVSKGLGILEAFSILFD